MAWHVLGFTSDDIIGGWQDSRLAEACQAAWSAAGRPRGFAIWQGAGEGEHFIFWYLEPAVAKVLDQQSVDWRRFIVGASTAVPPTATKVFNLGADA